MSKTREELHIILP